MLSGLFMTMASGQRKEMVASVMPAAYKIHIWQTPQDVTWALRVAEPFFFFTRNDLYRLLCPSVQYYSYLPEFLSLPGDGIG